LGHDRCVRCGDPNVAALCNAKPATSSMMSTPRLMAHDAATGYIGDDPLCGFYKTQTLGFADMLNCGVRAFDIRPFYLSADEAMLLSPGNIVAGWHFWHGNALAEAADAWQDLWKYISTWFTSATNYYTDQTIDSTIGEFIQWANFNPTELVILVVSHCGCHPSSLNGNNDCCRGDQSVPSVASVYEGHGIPVFNCSLNVSALTMADAMRMSTMDGGGHVLAFINGGKDNNDCGLNSNYELMGEVGAPNFDTMEAKVDDLLNHPEHRAGMWEVQGIWQLMPSLGRVWNSTWNKAVAGEQVVRYGTLSENEETNLNGWMQTTYATKGASWWGGLWLADNVCSGGVDFARALTTNVTESQANMCKAACANAKNKCGA